MLVPVTVWGTAIEARAVLRRDREHLLELLRALPPEAWERPTVCAPWRVRDVVAHVLGDDLGRLSRTRDGHDDGERPHDGEPFATFLARLNQRWVEACAGRSPAVLLEQLAATTPAVLAFWENLDLTRLGEPVTWAGPQPAPRWLDCARDFTEYWTHQRQIRDAVEAPHHDDLGIDHLALETFLRAVPHALRDLDPNPGTTATVVVTGPAGGRWNWAHSKNGWIPTEDPPSQATATVTVDQETLWRLCTRGIDPPTARTRARTVGPPRITDALTALVSIIY